MAKRKTRPMPLWGWPVLLTGAYLSGRLLSLAGAEFVLISASWTNGLMWGLLAGVCLGVSLWLSRVSSPEYALVIGILFFLFVSFQSQLDYLSGSKSWLHRQVHQVEDNPWPTEWRELDRDSLYETFIADQVDPSGIYWLDHMRAQAAIGIHAFEREGHRRYGGTRVVEVYRQDFWMWWGWFSCYLFLATGCFFGLFGAAIVEDRLPDEVDMALKVKEDVTEILRKKGLSKAEIDDILTRPSRRNEPVKKTAVASLLPKDDLLVDKITSYLQLAKNWIYDSRLERTLNEEDTNRLESLNQRFYGDQAVVRPEPWHLYLLAADSLHDQYPGEYFYDAMVNITNITCLLEIPRQIPPFAYIDLTGIHFKALTCGQDWRPLFGRGGNFYVLNSPWEKIQTLTNDKIPEDAHLAIIYQACHQPGQRAYEMWQGVTPSEMIERLAPGLRNGILTYLSGYPKDKPYQLGWLAAWAVDWPTDQAQELLLRCLHAGWLEAFKRVPKNNSWLVFLDVHSPSPFGNIENYVSWYRSK